MHKYPHANVLTNQGGTYEGRYGYQVESAYPRSDCHLRRQGNICSPYQALHGIAIQYIIPRKGSACNDCRPGFDVVMRAVRLLLIGSNLHNIYQLSAHDELKNA